MGWFREVSLFYIFARTFLRLLLTVNQVYGFGLGGLGPLVASAPGLVPGRVVVARAWSWGRAGQITLSVGRIVGLRPADHLAVSLPGLGLAHYLLNLVRNLVLARLIW